MDRIEALQAYVRVVELGSFTAAAADLQVKQSTVSKWLAALERELACRLVERTTRTQRVTDAGQRFYARAREILAAYESAVAEVADAQAAPRGRLRVSVPVVFGRLFISPALPRFMRDNPGIELELVSDDRYVNLVDEGIDLAVRVGRPVDSTFRTRVLATSPRRLVASPGYLRRHGRPEKPGDLERHTCLLHSGIRADETWVFRRAGRAARARVRGRFSANHSEAIRIMAKSGLGIALLADWLVRADLERGRLVELLDDYERVSAPVSAVLPPGRYVPLRVRAFLDFLKETLAPLNEVGAQ